MRKKGGLKSALLAMACSSVLAFQVSAQEAKEVNVPAGDLAAALQQYVRQTGVELVYRPEQLEGLSTRGVRGSLTPRQAVEKLIEQTSLELRSDQSGVLLIVDPADGGTDPASRREEGVNTLGEVRVVGRLDSLPMMARGETLRETPQSVSIITRQRIEDQNLVTLEDVLKESPGLTTQMQGMGQQRFYSRGYEISAIQLDGVPTRHSPWNVLTPDLVTYDRVEILRGADGLYSGAGSPGGTVNLARKKPLHRFQLTGAAVMASENYYRAEVDVTGPLTESGKLRGRLVGSYNDREFFYDIGEDRSTTAYATLAYDLTESTAISAGLEYRDAEGIPFMFGIPRYADGSSLGLPRSTFLNPAWNKREYRGVTTHVEVQQNIGPEWVASVTATRVDAQMKYKEGHLIWSSVGSDGMSYPEAYLAKYDDVQSGVDVMISGAVNLFGRSHDLQFGGSWQRHNYTWDDRPLDVGGDPLDVLNWNPYAFAEPADDQILDRWLSFNEVRQRGVFARARVRLTDRMSLIGGGRVSWYESVYRDDPNVTKQSGEFVPFGAAVFELNHSWSVYASHARIFEPQSNLRYFSGEALPPKLGTNIEAGIKGELMGERVNVSLAAFRVNEINRAQLDPVNPPTSGRSFYVAVGEVRSEGFELEINGAITPQWSLFGGYTYNTTEYRRDQAFEGLGFSTLTPRQLAKFWTTFRPQAMDGKLSLAAGITAQSEQYNRQGALKISQGGYAIVSAMIGYRFSDKMQVALNADNLFDRHYYENPGYLGGGAYYGAPRSVSLTLRAKY